MMLRFPSQNLDNVMRTGEVCLVGASVHMDTTQWIKIPFYWLLMKTFGKRRNLQATYKKYQNNDQHINALLPHLHPAAPCGLLSRALVWIWTLTVSLRGTSAARQLKFQGVVIQVSEITLTLTFTALCGPQLHQCVRVQREAIPAGAEQHGFSASRRRNQEAGGGQRGQRRT